VTNSTQLAAAMIVGSGAAPSALSYIAWIFLLLAAK
jgi:hypothetical protein